MGSMVGLKTAAFGLLVILVLLDRGSAVQSLRRKAHTPAKKLKVGKDSLKMTYQTFGAASSKPTHVVKGSKQHAVTGSNQHSVHKAFKKTHNDLKSRIREASEQYHQVVTQSKRYADIQAKLKAAKSKLGPLDKQVPKVVDKQSVTKTEEITPKATHTPSATSKLLEQLHKVTKKTSAAASAHKHSAGGAEAKKSSSGPRLNCKKSKCPPEPKKPKEYLPIALPKLRKKHGINWRALGIRKRLAVDPHTLQHAAETALKVKGHHHEVMEAFKKHCAGPLCPLAVQHA